MDRNVIAVFFEKKTFLSESMNKIVEKIKIMVIQPEKKEIVKLSINSDLIKLY